MNEPRDPQMRFDIDVSASPQAVWEMLTTDRGLASWFGTDASIEVEVGGTRRVSWGDGMDMLAELGAIDEPTRLQLHYLVDGQPTGAEEWLITSTDTTTRVQLVVTFDHDDPDTWDEFYGDVERGWRIFLTSMLHALDAATTPWRTVESAMLPCPHDRASVWARFDMALMSTDLVTGLDAAIEDAPHTRMWTAPDRTLVLDIEGTGEHQVLYAQAATHDGPAEWRRHAMGFATTTLAALNR